MLFETNVTNYKYFCHLPLYLLEIQQISNAIPRIEYTFFSLKIINKNLHKNILKILDQNRISIEVTFLYFSTNQLKTENKNILENPDQKLINKKYFRL